MGSEMLHGKMIVTLALTLGVAADAGAQQLRIVDNLPGQFIDISQTGGTPLGLLDDEEVELVTAPIGNDVFPSGSTIVANNGGLAFRNPVSFDLAPLNESIPSGNAFAGGQATLAFWDDIDDKCGDVFFAFFPDRLIVQWNNRNIGGTADTLTFQIQIFDQSAIGPNQIVAQYLFADVEQTRPGGGANATIGYQDGGAGFGDVQWSFNMPGAVSNGTVLSLVTTNSKPIPSASSWVIGLVCLVMLGIGIGTVRRLRSVVAAGSLHV